MAAFYLYIKSFHLIAVIAWMAGILYLLRLFAYHAAETEPVVKERFQMMERKLYQIITLPAMVIAFSLGMLLFYINPSLATQSWMIVKMLMFTLLISVTAHSNVWRKQLANGTCTRSSKFFRIMNELPTILMIVIVIMVIARPF